MNYSDKLKDPRWQRKRLEVMERDEFACRNCGDSESTLQVHHLAYSNDPWSIDIDKLLTLCEPCHKEFTEVNIEIKSILSKFNSIDSLCEVLDFLKLAIQTNPSYINSSVEYLGFIKDLDYKFALSMGEFIKKFKELSNG